MIVMVSGDSQPNDPDQLLKAFAVGSVAIGTVKPIVSLLTWNSLHMGLIVCSLSMKLSKQSKILYRYLIQIACQRPASDKQMFCSYLACNTSIDY